MNGVLKWGANWPIYEWGSEMGGQIGLSMNWVLKWGANRPIYEWGSVMGGK